MKFSSREDIEAPIDYVFSRVTDFEAFERQALRRGGEVERVDNMQDIGNGAAWKVKFLFRGKPRNLRAEVATFDAPQLLQVQTDTQGLTGTTFIELVALSPRRTRLSIGLEMKPKSLTARLMMQTLKLAKTNLNRKFKLRVSEFAEQTQEQYQIQA